ncbi:MAG: DNA repair protein RadC [Syntrophobacterales bacterium]|nr:MAG: DNA repair protein RadC [Syntrophobacterales bacterium]
MGTSDKSYKLRIRDLPEGERPREKLKKYGPASLKNYELMAVILGKGTRREGILELSKRIMSQYGDQAIFSRGDVDILQRVLNVSTVQACQVVAAFELGKRLFGRPTEVFLRSPEEVFEYAKDMTRLKKEHLRGLYLDTRNKLIRDEIIAIGTLNASLAHPREIFHPAIESRCAGIILVHNHPSGDPLPSKDDVELTRQIYEASKIMEIDILDHVIIGSQDYCSLKESTEIWPTSKKPVPIRN